LETIFENKTDYYLLEIIEGISKNQYSFEEEACIINILLKRGYFKDEIFEIYLSRLQKLTKKIEIDNKKRKERILLFTSFLILLVLLLLFANKEIASGLILCIGGGLIYYVTEEKDFFKRKKNSFKQQKYITELEIFIELELM